MNRPVITIVAEGSTRQRKREAPRGRRVDPEARAAVRELLGDEPRRSDLLIEHLHKIQDRHGCLSTAHLAALAEEMQLAQAEVYEVATFYHHFDVVKEGDAVPPAITVRVCDGLSCEMAGAQDLLARLPALLGDGVRVIAAPCIGRCEQAPAAVVGQNPVPLATTDKVQALVAAKQTRHEPEGFVDLAPTRPEAAMPCCASASAASSTSKTSSRRSKPRACAASAAPAFRPAASGASCATSRRRG